MVIFQSKSTRPKSRSYRDSSLIPTVTAERLLVHRKRQNIVKKINKLTSSSNVDYDYFYGVLISNFVEFVQLLPVAHRGGLCGLMNEGLVRGLLALELRPELELEHESDLLTYAMVSAALLLDLGKVMLERKVIIADHKGRFVKQWSPFDGTLEAAGDYYLMRQYSGCPEALGVYSTPLLARQLMPEAGFQWLASNDEILAMWLAVLNGDEAKGGVLAKLLALVKLRLPKFLLDMPEIELEFTDSPETEAGETFLKWLRDGLENQSISVNRDDSMVHMLEEGVFLDYPALFKDMSNYYPKYRDWIVTYQQFNYLGMAALSGADYRHKQFFAESPEFRLRKAARAGGGKMFAQAQKTKGAGAQKGALVKEAGYLFRGKIPNVNKKVELQTPAWFKQEAPSAEVKSTKGPQKSGQQ